MNVTNIVRAVVKPGSDYTVTSPIMKENKGQILLIEGLDLPEIYEIDFSNDRHHGTSVTMIGNADGVLIPTQFIKTGRDVYAFYYYVGDSFGQTEHIFRLPNDFRPDRTDEEPEPEQQSTIDQAIAAVNEAVVKTEENKTAAKNSADSAKDDADRAERARDAAEGHSRDAGNAANRADTSERNAKGYSEDAGRSANQAATSEHNAADSAAEAGRKADEITGLTVEAETLTPGSEATADYQNGQLVLGIPRGDKGEKGDTGATGPRGAQGIQGPKGDKGDTGPKGDKGDQGIQGIQGPKGDKGDTGPQGVKGDTGEQGIQGEQGERGLTGATGATGATPNLTIGTVETLEPTESATATITGTPENPVLNLGIPQGKQGEVTTEEFLKAFVTDSVSGSIASFPDGADNIPLKSLVVDINPVQDLHGYDHPWPAGGGKNKINAPDVTISSGSYLYNGALVLPAGTYTLRFTSSSGASTSASIAITDADGTAMVTGGHVIPYTFTLPNASANVKIYVSGAGTYTNIQIEEGSSATEYAPYENICPISGWTGVNVYDDPIYGREIMWNQVASLDTSDWIFGSRMSMSVNGRIMTFTLTSSSSIKHVDLPLMPYHKYLFDATIKNTMSNSAFYGIWMATIDNNYVVRTSTTAGVTERKQLIWEANTETPFFRFQAPTSVVASESFTVENMQLFDLTLMFGEGNEPATVEEFYELFTDEYHEYNTGEKTCVSAVNGTPHTLIPISWQSEAGTVYGGKLDVLSGVLRVDMAMVDLGTLSWSVNSTGVRFYGTSNSTDFPYKMGMATKMLCSVYKYDGYGTSARGYYGDNGTFRYAYTTAAFMREIYIHDDSKQGMTGDEFKTAMSGVQLVYELAEPIEIQLTPQQVNSLLGTNNIWADTGDTEVEYRADTKLYIEKLTQPEEDDMIADSAISSGQFFMVGNTLYRALANIASGATITVGTNAQRVSLSDALNLVNA